MRSTIFSVGALALLAALPASDATAGMIYTASLEEVVDQSTHIVLVEKREDAWHVRPELWLRGTWPEKEFEVHGVPRAVRRWFPARGVTGPRRDPRVWRRRVSLTKRLLLFLEAVDGRLYLTGYRRYGRGFGAHASVRLLDAEGRPVRLRQIINPGDPAPSEAERGTEKELLALVRSMLPAHPYRPPPGDRPPLAPKHRASFFAALDGVVDWYQGGWHSDLRGWGGEIAGREQALAAADRLEAWMDGVPPRARVHGLDALMLMGRTVQGRGVVHPEVVARARGRLHDVPPGVAEAWILRELRWGGYYANREAFARLARDLGPASYRKTLDVLVGWVERTEVNEGTDCWWTLVNLGHRDLAEAAARRREARRLRASGTETTSD